MGATTTREGGEDSMNILFITHDYYPDPEIIEYWLDTFEFVIPLEDGSETFTLTTG